MLKLWMNPLRPVEENLEVADGEITRLKSRVAELEAYNATRTDEMLAATMRIAELEAQHERNTETLRILNSGLAESHRERDEALRQVHVLRDKLRVAEEALERYRHRKYEIAIDALNKIRE